MRSKRCCFREAVPIGLMLMLAFSPCTSFSSDAGDIPPGQSGNQGPQPGEIPGNSGNANPHGSPPGQGGPPPGNSADHNPHGTPPGKRMGPDSPSGSLGGGPHTLGGRGGGSVRDSGDSTTKTPGRHWPPSTRLPTWDEINRRLGSDNTAYFQDHDVTSTTVTHYPGGIQQSVS